MSNPLSTFVRTQHKLLKLLQEELAFKAGVGIVIPSLFRTTVLDIIPDKHSEVIMAK